MFTRKSALILLLLTFLSACGTSPTAAAPTPILATVEVTRIVPVKETEMVEVEVIKIVTPTPKPTRVKEPVAVIEENAKYTGRYITETRGIDGLCSLNIIHTITDYPMNTIDFEMLCSRGAPSYNMGYARGSMLLGAKSAVYERFSDTHNESCYLVFRFEEESIEVEQIGMDYVCGFGHAVYADGIYNLIDRNPPERGSLYPER